MAVFTSKADFYDGSPIFPGNEASDPHITSLSPNTLPASASATTITVTGSNFVSGSVVEIAQQARATTYVSATSLTVSYDPIVAGTVNFTVRNPNAEESNSVPFTVTAGTEEEPQTQPQPQSEPEPDTDPKY